MLCIEWCMYFGVVVEIYVDVVFFVCDWFGCDVWCVGWLFVVGLVVDVCGLFL